MKEKFLNYANILESTINTDILYDLSKIFNENDMFHEEGACLEKIFHITHSPELFEKIGDIFINKVRNKEIGNAAYNKYLYNLEPKFYKKYANNLKNLGYNFIDTESNDENIPSELTSICDRFDTIVYMMICLHKIQDFDSIMEMKPNLLSLKNKILEYANTNNIPGNMYIDELNNTEVHLSNILSNTKNRNDINEFAIFLNKENKQAYINIMGDYIMYKNYPALMDFYKQKYAQISNKSNQPSIVNICYEISDYYRDKYEFFDAVKFQKFALEYEVLNEKL